MRANTYVASLHEGEGLTADKGVAVRGIGIFLPKGAWEENG